uniref:Odorant-binding protein 11 n=1 Tax=Propsilocerus akamusi TaxID=903466 RepID=A0A7D0PAX3_9DIPT|nr:odorant-binding protein 11 [Propsilocerus akamusi]QGW50681.1 odorant-binding protein 17 [Propsilocerus akamusi]
MKLILVFGFLFAAVASQSNEPSEHDRHRQFCMTKTGIDRATVMKIRNGDFNTDDENAKCFLKCYFQQKGLINDADDIRIDMIVSSVATELGTNENTNEKLKKCILQGKSSNGCETAYNIYKCFRSELALPRSPRDRS